MLRWTIIVAVTVVCTVTAFRAFVLCGSGGQIQAANMARAESHLPEVKALFATNPRWAGVEAHVYTGQWGSIQLFGRVETLDDLFRLMRAVADLQLSVPIHWLVKVDADEKP